MRARSPAAVARLDEVRDGGGAAVRADEAEKDETVPDEALKDEGSAVPVMAAVIAVICVIAIVVTAWGGGLVRVSHARSAADLAALAAAQVDRHHRALGASPALALEHGCNAARDVATANGASLDSCVRAPGYSVLVEVSVAGPRGMPTATAASRAGPRI